MKLYTGRDNLISIDEKCGLFSFFTMWKIFNRIKKKHNLKFFIVLYIIVINALK